MVVYSNGMRYQTSGKHAWWTTTWERAEKRRQRKLEDFSFGTDPKVTQKSIDDTELQWKMEGAAKNQYYQRNKNKFSSKVKAFREAEKKDSLTRKINRLEKQVTCWDY